MVDDENKQMERKFMVLNKEDNVAVALMDLPAGMGIEIDTKKFILSESVPFRLKFSIKEIKKGTSVIKDGIPIGYALNDIELGRVVHVHNVASERSKEWKQ